MHRPDPVLAFNDPLHDSSFCMYGEDSVIHIESERYTRRKYEFINPVLTFCELFPNKVDEFFHIVFEESDYAVAPFIRKLLDLKSRSGPRAADAAELNPPYAVDYLLEHLKFLPATNSTAAVARFVKHLLCDDVQIFFCGHHAAHAANAFFSSPFPRALTITLDGGGFDYELEGAGRSITREAERLATRRIYGGVYRCSANQCEPLYQLTDFSFGLAWARVVGEIFRLADGEEGTVMAMAALGDPRRYRDVMEAPWLWLPTGLDLSADRRGQLGAFEANLRDRVQTEQDRFDLAAALEAVTEARLIEFLGRFIGHEETDLCLSGGFFLNCQMAGKIKSWFPQVRGVYIPPAPYDGGISIGAAQLVYHSELGHEKRKAADCFAPFAMGKRYSRLETISACRSARVAIAEATAADIVQLLLQGKIIGLFSGPAESGRRALGHRSIIADPRSAEIKDRLNAQIKHRQWFRPFAPVVLAEHAAEWFDCAGDFASPYMSFAVAVKPQLRGRIPGVVHFDGTARVQTVHRELTPGLHALLTEWHALTGVPILLNTSFNDREPIVETPAEALNTMKQAGVDGVFFADIGAFATERGSNRQLGRLDEAPVTDIGDFRGADDESGHDVVRECALPAANRLRIDGEHAGSDPADRKVTDWSREVMSDSNWRDHEAFNRACDAAFAELRRVTPHRPFTAEVPTVVCVVRNEELRLPHFIQHYKTLGVECLHIIDNGSTDETPNICAADDSITLWHITASYAAAGYGQLWVGAIVRKYGLGKWVLNVDADEHFVYPGMDRYDVGDLQDWLAAQGYRRVFAPMIDMYGSRAYGVASERDYRPLLSQNPFFDGGMDLGRRSYMFEETPFGPLLAGGPRSRIMSAGDPRKFCLSKFPLSLWEADTAYANPHYPYPFSDNPGTAHGALLHFKFLSDFHDRVATAVAEGEHWNSASESRDYQRWISEGGGHAALFSTPYSRIYRGPDSLIAAGLIGPISWGEQAGERYRPIPARHPDRADPALSEAEPERAAAVPERSPGADSLAAQLWSSDAALRAVETRCDHRIEARRAILQFIFPGTVGAELGVFTGLFSEFILRNSSPRLLHLVDPWWTEFGEFFPDWGEYTAQGKLSTRVAQAAAATRAETARGGCTVECHVASSVDWLAQQDDASLDWVYLDSTHHYEATTRELQLLCGKVRPNGYILGDDWHADPSDPDHAVFRAVHDELRRNPELELVYAGADCQYALRIIRGG